MAARAASRSAELPWKEGVVGEHGERGRAARLIGARDARGIEIGGENALAGRSFLDFGDDGRRPSRAGRRENRGGRRVALRRRDSHAESEAPRHATLLRACWRQFGPGCLERYRSRVFSHLNALWGRPFWAAAGLCPGVPGRAEHLSERQINPHSAGKRMLAILQRRHAVINEPRGAAPHHHIAAFEAKPPHGVGTPLAAPQKHGGQAERNGDDGRQGSSSSRS